MAARWRAAGAVLLAALLAAGAAGCGGGGAPDRTPSPAPSSVAPSTALPSPTDRSPHGVLLAAQLVLHDARRAEFRSSLDGDTARGLVFWAPKTVLQLKRDGSAQQLTVLDTTAYLGGDPATAARLGGRHWEKFPAHTGPDGQKEIPYAGLFDRINPQAALTAAATADDPVLVGEEQLQESTARHYRVTLTPAGYAAAQTQLPAARRQALEAGLSAGGVARLTLDLWLNDKDQLVQLRRSGEGPTGRVDDTLAYREYGGPLSVQAPAEADTADAGGRTPPALG